MKQTSFFSLLFLVCATSFVHATFTPHMYHASPYNFGTRFERKGMFTVSGYGHKGDTTKGKNSNGDTTNVLNMYGLHKFHQVGKNVTDSNLSVLNKNILDTLWHVTPTDANYATLQFSGKAKFEGANIAAAVNLSDEFFVGVDVPLVKLEIKNPTFTDTTPTDVANYAEWVQFYNNLDSILSQVGLTRDGTQTKTEVNDITVFAGWARSVDDLDNLDFIDATFTVGGLLGNGPAKDEDKVFSIAPGYDKHKGVLFAFDTAFGTSEYITFGFHTKQVILFKKSKNMRIQTALNQNGFIKLQKTRVQRDMGNLYEIGGFLKFEAGALSVHGGYTFSHKNSDSLIADNALLYPGSNINTDTMLQGWSMHTVHVGADIDLTHAEHIFHPKIGVFYNHVIRAKQAFLNHTVGGNAGLSVTFDF